VATDLDRLHEVAKWDRVPGVRPFVPRGGGVTYYDCHLVAGVVSLGEEAVACVVPEYRWLAHVLPMMREVFQEAGLPFKRTSQLRFESGETLIRFAICANPDFALRFCGYTEAMVYFR